MRGFTHTHTHTHTRARIPPKKTLVGDQATKPPQSFPVSIKGKGPVWGVARGRTAVSKTTPVRTSPRRPNACLLPCVCSEFWAGVWGGRGQAFSCSTPAQGNGRSPGFVLVLQSWRALLLAADPRAARKPRKMLENKEARNTLRTLLPTGSIPNQNEK